MDSSTNLPQKEIKTDDQLQKPESNFSAYMVGLGLLVLALGVLVFYYMGMEKISDIFIYKFLAFGIAAIIIILGIVFLILAKQGKIKKELPDYKNLFILGIIWIPLGIALDNYAFTVMGAVFAVIGGTNKDKWREQPKWNELPPMQKKIKLTMLIILSLLLLFGLFMYFEVARGY